MGTKVEKPISILHVVISFNTGGLERFVLDLIEANENDFNQYVLCLEQAGELSNNCKAELISIDMPPGLQLDFSWRIAKIVREKQVDIIHTHNEKAQLYGGIAGLMARVPVVHTKHGRNKTDWRTILRNNISARMSRKVVGVSRDAAVECVRNEKISPSKVITILNGVDTDRFSPGNDKTRSKKRLSIDGDVFVIGIVARLAQIKDHVTLLEACRLLVENEYEFRLLVVGDGPLRGQLEEHANFLGISNQVIFTGMREDVTDLMRAMDVFCLSSLSEGISLTLLEAMACGLPTVATAVGGNPEVIVGGKTGFLVTPSSPGSLYEKLVVLISNEQIRVTMGKAGRDRVINHFSLQACAHAYRNLYISVAGAQD